MNVERLTAERLLEHPYQDMATAGAVRSLLGVILEQIDGENGSLG